MRKFVKMQFICDYPDKSNFLSCTWSMSDNTVSHINKGNNKITELRTILQRESQNS